MVIAKVAGSKLIVRRVLHGVAPPTIVFNGEGECGRPMDQGEEYLVYPARYKGRLVVNGCTRVLPMAKATEELAMIRRLANGRNAGSIYVGLNTQGKEVAGELKIDLERNGQELKELKVSSGPGGWEIYGLRPGTYQLRITLADDLLFLRRSIKINDRSCEDVGVLGISSPEKR